MFTTTAAMRVYLALGHTDMRKSINGLSILVESHLDLNPFSGHFFVFCNRKCHIMKILYWDKNGFCLWQKRLEKHRFKWPLSAEEVMEIGHRELSWLLEGLDLSRIQAHERLSYNTVI
jgi:transposase